MVIFDEPRYMVYADGTTDVLTASQFAGQDYFLAFAGPFTNVEQLEAAAHALQIDECTAEPLPLQGWQLVVKQHAFVPGSDPRYCAAIVDTLLDGRPVPCLDHARYHADAPADVRDSIARSLYPCYNARTSEYIKLPPPTCDNQEARVIVCVGEKTYRRYCTPCAMAATVNPPVCTCEDFVAHWHAELDGTCKGVFESSSPTE